MPMTLICFLIFFLFDDVCPCMHGFVFMKMLNVLKHTFIYFLQEFLFIKEFCKACDDKHLLCCFKVIYLLIYCCNSG